MESTDLTFRSQEILRAVVNLFVETGEPVGSRTLSKRAPIACSPATIRNILSDLAEAGLLTKPHVSAGRMPTDLGYRIYVNGLMGRHEPTAEERLTIEAGYSREIRQVEQILAHASRVLSELTNQAGLVLLPGGGQLEFQHIEFIRNAMVGVNKEGTGARAFAGAGYTSAGKTGTAQVIALKQNEKYDASRLQERHRDHALFIAFAPVESPKIALAVLVENAGFGARAAAPIARQVLDYYLLGKRVPPADKAPAGAVEDDDESD